MYAQFVLRVCFPRLMWACSPQGPESPRPVLPAPNRHPWAFNWRGVATLLAEHWDLSCGHWECISISIAADQSVHNDNLKLWPLGEAPAYTHRLMLAALYPHLPRYTQSRTVNKQVQCSPSSGLLADDRGRGVSCRRWVEKCVMNLSSIDRDWGCSTGGCLSQKGCRTTAR